MAFDPVKPLYRYGDLQPGEAPDVLKLQEAASGWGGLPVVVASEIDQLRQADRVVFHSPLWWFNVPVLLKGWFDRVFAHGAIHRVDRRFDHALFDGKVALLSVTADSTALENAPNWREGDIDLPLRPTHCKLRYLGFVVFPSGCSRSPRIPCTGCGPRARTTPRARI